MLLMSAQINQFISQMSKIWYINSNVLMSEWTLSIYYFCFLIFFENKTIPKNSYFTISCLNKSSYGFFFFFLFKL